MRIPHPPLPSIAARALAPALFAAVVLAGAAPATAAPTLTVCVGASGAVALPEAGGACPAAARRTNWAVATGPVVRRVRVCVERGTHEYRDVCEPGDRPRTFLRVRRFATVTLCVDPARRTVTVSANGVTCPARSRRVRLRRAAPTPTAGKVFA